MLMNVPRLLANMVVGVWMESMATLVTVILLDIMVHTAKLVSVEIYASLVTWENVSHHVMLML